MQCDRRLLATVLLAVACGCAARWPWARVPAPSNLRGVALVVEGPAFAHPEVVRRVAEAVEQANGRRVVVLDAGVPDKGAVKELAARLTKAHPSIASYDWRERRCRAAAPVLVALTADVDAVYRVSLRYDERTRPATMEETAKRGRAAAALHALHLAPDDTVREESVSGGVVVTSFAGDDRAGRVTIARSAKHVAPSALTERLDPATIAIEAIRSLPPLPLPRWDVVARRLTATGCPFAALAVSETRLDGVAAGGPLRTTALAAMRQHKKRAPSKVSPTPPPSPQDAEDTGVAGTRPPDERYSCTVLCGMHMVEICNGDRALWSAHGIKWQATPCGTKREEPFLADCYRRQWLTGAFHDSCVVPCENAPEGRDRLLGILHTAGCLHARSS